MSEPFYYLRMKRKIVSSSISKAVRNLHTGETYYSISHASNETGQGVRRIRAHASGKVLNPEWEFVYV